MFERFTERSRQVVVLAQDEARVLKSPAISTDHLLLGLLREEHGIANRVLSEFGITADGTRRWVLETYGEGGVVWTRQIPFTPRAKKVLELALREALDLGQNYIGTEHILLGLIRETDGPVARYLRELDLPVEHIREAVLEHMTGKQALGDPNELPAPLVVAARSVHEGLSSLIAGALQIEQGLKVIVEDLEERGRRARQTPDSPPPEEPSSSQ